ncbi:hypothetical protein QSJ19_15170 [Gordonia sp. ABSL11-1]|uniref:hypothetical protein n=1 Tax=Gordonia sp. ABSL11-1 TaxID=3053924 RepID=UPI002573D5EC|nr:hypothetical protein [Gordonia sp. ABSL11-1]MDL9946904.1 hypothetical protein [Gordonia sp. ABSL11-1]
MLSKWQRQRAARRVQPGDGYGLQPFRWWQLPGRALLSLPLPDDTAPSRTYTVDVRHWQNQSSGDVTADLYLDGRHHASSKLPARFPVEGGTIEVAMSGFGLKRCHFVTTTGAEHQLSPDPRSAEGRRARLQHRHPALSSSIGALSVTLLLIGVALLALQIAEPISQIPPIADSLGIFVSPIALPVWLNIALGVGAAIASMERALRLRYHWLLDAAAN